MGVRLGTAPRYRNRSAEALDVGLFRIRRSLLRLSAQADKAGETRKFACIQTAISALDDANDPNGRLL
jgi:hypothetical protein